MTGVAAILLAAGESQRMERPKALLPWGDETLIEYQLRQLHEAGAEPIVTVLGHDAEEVLPYAGGESPWIVRNDNYLEGPASSLRLGAAALPADAAAVLVLRVDQPRPAAVISRVVDEHALTGALISVPAHRGRRGHPPVLDGSLLPELLEVRDDTLGLRAVIERHAQEVREIEFDTPVVLLDLNRPEDYEAAKVSYFATTPAEGHIRSS